MTVSSPAAAVVLAAGDGTRVGGALNKVFLPLAGRSVISWSINTLAANRSIRRVVLMVRAADRGLAAETVDREVEGVGVEILVGGSSRHESELRAMHHLAPQIQDGSLSMVVVHDGARPLVSARLVDAVLTAAAANGAAIPCLQDDGLRRTRADGTLCSESTEQLVRVQTPQAFEARRLLDAYVRAESESFLGTDTSASWEKYVPSPVGLVPGDPRNLKITFPGDLLLAESVLRVSHSHVD